MAGNWMVKSVSVGVVTLYTEDRGHGNIQDSSIFKPQSPYQLSDSRRNTNSASAQDSINSPFQTSSNGYSKKASPRLRDDAYDDPVYPGYQSSASPSYQEALRDDYQRKYVNNADDLHQPVKSTGEPKSAIRRVSMKARFPQVDREEDTVASAFKIQEDVSRVVFRDEEGDSEGDLGSIVEGRYYDSNLVRIKTPAAKSGAYTTHEQEKMLLEALHHKMNDSDHPRGFDQGLAEMLEEMIEAPVIEAPVIEAPVIEAPVIEAPVIEAPVIEAPGKPLDLCSGGMLWSCCVNKNKLEEHGDTTVGTLQNANLTFCSQTLKQTSPYPSGTNMFTKWIVSFSSPYLYGTNILTQWIVSFSSPYPSGTNMFTKWIVSFSSPYLSGTNMFTQWIVSFSSPYLSGTNMFTQWIVSFSSPYLSGTNMFTQWIEFHSAPLTSLWIVSFSSPYLSGTNILTQWIVSFSSPYHSGTNMFTHWIVSFSSPYPSGTNMFTQWIVSFSSPYHSGTNMFTQWIESFSSPYLSGTNMFTQWIVSFSSPYPSGTNMFTQWIVSFSSPYHSGTNILIQWIVSFSSPYLYGTNMFTQWIECHSAPLTTLSYVEGHDEYSKYCRWDYNDEGCWAMIRRWATIGCSQETPSC
uniref:Uncharacterized protein n=1 Tax=Timema monikensis TaxID=170555 RepID=A0A7R9E948_9NEOP|nr:unnamed protein product [Timema monikensis]